MYKLSAIYYPVTIKIYDDVEQLIYENNYEQHRQFLLGVTEMFNAADFSYDLTESKTALLITGIFETQDQLNQTIALLDERAKNTQVPAITRLYAGKI